MLVKTTCLNERPFSPLWGQQQTFAAWSLTSQPVRTAPGGSVRDV